MTEKQEWGSPTDQIESSIQPKTEGVAFKEKLVARVDRWNQVIKEIQTKLSETSGKRFGPIPEEFQGKFFDKFSYQLTKYALPAEIAGWAKIPVGLAEITTRMLKDRLKPELKTN